MADARRALWLESDRVLVVADLHLGYAWAHRHAGQLMPLSMREDTTDRLVELQRDYGPKETVLLGDIVHRTVPVPALEAALQDLVKRVSATSKLTFVRGNHDQQLEHLTARCFKDLKLETEARFGHNLLIHGDQVVTTTKVERIIMGHEHPAVWLDDGVATGMKCPCFLVSPRVVILPAFSRWAAGMEVGRHRFLSPLARATRFTMAAAILGDKLLPVRL